MKGTRTQRSGFTLIELLVVIAIISILATILLPSLKMAKDLAQEAVCSGQLKSCGVGFQLYFNDNPNKSFMYICENVGGVTPGNTFWFTRISEQIYPGEHPDWGNRNPIFHCPSNNPPDNSLSYAYNGASPFMNNWGITNHSHEEMQSPASALVMAESAVTADGNYHVYYLEQTIGGGGYMVPGSPSTKLDNIGYVHREGSNILFADWHVGWQNDRDQILEMMQAPY